MSESENKIDKTITKSFELIHKINQEMTYTVTVGKSTKHSFSNSIFNIKKENDHYAFTTKTRIKKGIQREKELRVSRDTEIRIRNKNIELFTLGKYLHVSGISYSDDVMNEKNVSGKISSISNRKSVFFKKPKYYRAIIPLERKVDLRGDFTGWHYLLDDKATYDTLLKINIHKNEYHFYRVIDLHKNHYFIIDSCTDILLDSFKYVVNSIILTYAFLKGDYHGKEIYFLTFNNSSFNVPSGILSINLGGGIYDGFAVHTTRPFSFVQFQDRLRHKKDSKGKIIGIKNNQYKKYMVEFPESAYSKLCELIISKGGILRAVILFVRNHSTSLEIKIPTQFVALENITKVLVGGDTQPPELIEDKEIKSKMKKIVKNTVSEMKKIQNEYRPSDDCNAEELASYNSSFESIYTKMHNYNRGSNNKKLVAPFEKFKYLLSNEEKELIIRDRNKFLHGDDFLPVGEDEEEFKELVHISMRLHRLISVLLLKASGFSGYIINNPKIYESISEKRLREPLFLKI